MGSAFLACVLAVGFTVGLFSFEAALVTLVAVCGIELAKIRTLLERPSASERIRRRAGIDR
jgi:hypothetical protein